MQNAKDSFYLALRKRLSAVNPARMVTLAGVNRPGIMVRENESPALQVPPDVFVLTWSGTACNLALPAALETQTCEISYWTRGSDTNAATDRGRLLTAMDAELLAILQPSSTAKETVAGSNDLPMSTTVFWSAAAFDAVRFDGSRVSRSATVQVFSLQEVLSNGGEER